MNADLREALGAASDAARADFETRDASHVIAPASKRVRRQRAAAMAAGTAGAVVLLGGVLWGAQTLGMTGFRTLDPANPGEPTGQPDVTGVLSEVPWSTLSLAAVTEPRAQGEKRADSVAGMICHHDEPGDDPRVALREMDGDTTSNVTVVEDCTPVWFENGPFTSVRDLSISTTDMPSWTLSSHALVRNLSGRPLAIDADSVYMTIETSPGEPSATVTAVYSHTVVGGSTWDESDRTVAILRSDDEATIIEDNAFLPVATLASDGSAESTLAALIKSGDRYTVTFWARIHEEKPNGDASYVIRLGEPQEFGGVDGN
jgi:hypothetical protein